MRFYVTFMEDSSVSLRIPTPAIHEATETTRMYFEDLRKNNKVVDWGFFSAGHGLYAILNVRNHAELYEITELTPIRAFWNVECTPVMDASEYIEVSNKIKREATLNYEKLSKYLNRSARD